MLPGLRSRGDAERRGQRQAAFLAGTQRNWAAAEPAPPRPWTGPAARLRPRLARLHLPDAPLQPQQSRTRPARAAAPGPPPSPGPSSAHARPGTTEAARWGDLGPQSHGTCWDQAEAIGHQAEARQHSGSERGPQCWAGRGRGPEGAWPRFQGWPCPPATRPPLTPGVCSAVASPRAASVAAVRLPARAAAGSLGCHLLATQAHRLVWVSRCSEPIIPSRLGPALEEGVGFECGETQSIRSSLLNYLFSIFIF